ncbi:sigma24 (plasmid) [Ketogulonicigenium vulgare Y25]|uniref:RNA polymerase sigma factor n=1 Tax=Ketogulonicigenium vulgare (strain WSH-001) TaxID=759362 RepID=F9YBN4_KETVW|nr:sigma-70 family RNA polymerase sigma factor [Ketogulonicigenium vulgare]ADO44353.1 sigma24 [Ketogulonicigenium vulgare Y25]AEM42786.1 RNA polymerase sigma factor [Ketogulonicigenium vulgare WSH-001]
MNAIAKPPQPPKSDVPPLPDPRQEILLHLPALRAFALTLSRDSVLADDLVQETLMKAWSKFHLFTPGTNLRSWLFTVLRNNMRSMLRKRSREVADVDEKMAARLASKPNQESNLALKEVELALDKLPAEQREVLILVGAMGFSIEEAAETCGCAPGTIKSRANRGRLALARLLGLAPGEKIDISDQATLAVMSQRP